MQALTHAGCHVIAQKSVSDHLQVFEFQLN